MVRKYHIVFLIVLLLTGANKLAGQYDIHFAHITVDQGMQRAQIEDKAVFVDTYAKWCGPCKKMDIVFKDYELAKYLNKHFINVKVDMDNPHGKTLSSRFRIAFLPTLLILDKYGNVKFKIDRLLSANELLSIAQLAVQGFATPSITKAPEPKETKEPVVDDIKIEEPITQTKVKTKLPNKKAPNKSDIPKDNPDEKILYILDSDAPNLPPEILFQEAYFRMQFMDGSHRSTAEKYLESQTDWFTEKNVKFIFDFLYDTNSESFDFFVKNKNLFDEIVGKSKTDRGLHILVNDRLYQGIPRPTLEESIYLLELIDTENGKSNAYQYYLNRLFENEEFDKFSSLAKEFLVDKKDQQEISILYTSYILEQKPNKKSLRYCDDLLKSIESPTLNSEYFTTLAKLKYQQSEKDKALDAAEHAIIAAKIEEKDPSALLSLLELIKEL